LGKYGYKYPKDSTVNVKDKYKVAHSKEFNCDLPWAILLDGTHGIYFHEDVTSRDLSHGNTHGCINLVKGDAEDLYNAVTGKTRILIEYDW
jgi:lipoprotein-anchoring transpeptidase ErfK/SrfK